MSIYFRWASEPAEIPATGAMPVCDNGMDPHPRSGTGISVIASGNCQYS
ncbi:MAG TPA: hypothetical protein VK589_15980 [Chryseolinea sp.]|nr:hypothetical protein [Chryseolinea sp.]